ncbi:hypothetical protein DY000_02059537 [Brassica cretica]|uniref:Uncharacterized protein n=1 Tax=Brassica cretica TaxID=69181 RepID=A0ABQ7AP99_BRACR|nr:hypothetical protein DY000_02059537 [Brassica cretica]
MIRILEVETGSYRLVNQVTVRMDEKEVWLSVIKIRCLAQRRSREECWNEVRDKKKIRVRMLVEQVSPYSLDLQATKLELECLGRQDKSGTRPASTSEADLSLNKLLTFGERGRTTGSFPGGKNLSRTKDKGVSQSLELKKVLAQFSKLHQSPVFKSSLSQTMRLKCPNYSLWVRMMKKNPRGKDGLSHTSDEAPWQIYKVLAHGNEWRPEALSLSNKSCFKLEEKRGQKSPQCKGGLTKDSRTKKTRRTGGDPMMSSVYMEVQGSSSEPVALSAGVGVVVLLVQETHKKAYYLSHEENDESVGLSADVGIVVLPVPKTLELKTDGELVGLSADVDIVVLPVSKLIGAHLQACPYTKSSLRKGISELPERPKELSVSHFLIEGQQEVGDLKGQQEVGDLKEGLSDQYEEAVTPH